MFWFKKFVIRCRAIIIHDGKLFVVKHPQNTNFAVLPGGHLEWGEDVKEAMSREIAEELGIVPEIGRLLYVNNFMDGKRKQSIEFFFEILNSHDFKDVKCNERTPKDEICEMFWLEPSSSINILPKTLWEDFQAGRIISDEVRYINSK